MRETESRKEGGKGRSEGMDGGREREGSERQRERKH